MKRAALLGLIPLLLIGAACGDDAGDASAGVQVTNAPATPLAEEVVTDDGAAGAVDAPSGAAPDVPSANRALIVNATIAMEADDVQAAVTSAGDIAVAAGGLVTTADVQLEAPAKAFLTLRVPPEKVESVLDSLSGLGRVTSRGKSTEDATSRVVDLESRITSARKSVERAREFLDKATRVQDLAVMEAELASRELVLEQLLAQQRELDDHTSLAAIDVTFSAKEAAPGVVEPAPEEDEPGLSPLDALKNGASALLNIVLTIVVVLAAMAPFIAVAGLVWLVGRRPIKALVRRLRASYGARSSSGYRVPPPPPGPLVSSTTVRPPAPTTSAPSTPDTPAGTDPVPPSAPPSQP